MSVSELQQRALRASPVHFAGAVRRARRCRGISRRGLTRKCGLTRRVIAEIETRRFAPTEALLAQLGTGLGTDVVLAILNEEYIAQIGGEHNLLRRRDARESGDAGTKVRYLPHRSTPPAGTASRSTSRCRCPRRSARDRRGPRPGRA